MSTYTANQLDQIPAAIPVCVTTVAGEEVNGLFDGAFGIDATGEIKGAQVATGALSVRYFDKAEIASVVSA